MIVDSLRGVDSTGVAVVNRVDDVKVAKAVGNPFELVESRTYTNALVGANKVIIGHNRYGTQGKVNKRNAHPFEFDTLVGAHNGTLRSKHKLDDSRNFDVDSENLYHHIDKLGLHSAMEHLEGAWSLVWWDKLEGTLNFLRNKERPMYITKDAAGTCMFWASEDWMLRGCMGRAGVGYQPVIETEVDMHYSFEINNFGVISKPRVVEMKSRHVPFVTGATYTTWNNGVKTVHQVGGGVKPPLTVVAANSSNKGSGGVQSDPKNVNAQQQSGVNSTHLSAGNSYAFSKDIELVVLGLGTDMHGARYHLCEDANYPDRTIRLYVNHGKENEYRNGDEIVADIGPLVVDSKFNNSYFKVVFSSVKKVPDATALDLAAGEPAYKDANGRDISLEDFMTKYVQCAVCTGWVDPDKPHKFVASSDDAVCEICIKDASIGQYVRYR